MPNWTANLPPASSAPAPSDWHGQEDARSAPNGSAAVRRPLGFLPCERGVGAACSLGREVRFIVLYASGGRRCSAGRNQAAGFDHLLLIVV